MCDFLIGASEGDKGLGYIDVPSCGLTIDSWLSCGIKMRYVDNLGFMGVGPSFGGLDYVRDGSYIFLYRFSAI